MTRFTDHGLAWLTLEDPRTLGGPGSGNFGHAGRPGEVGGSAEGGFGVHARVYRGGVQQDASTSFKGFVYVSTNRQNAEQWGDVREYEIIRPQKLVDLDDWNAPGSKQLVAYIQGLDQAQMSLLDFQDEAVQVFVQGDPRIIPWLTKHGYTGMRYGDDAALVGALTDHAKLTTAGGPGSGNFGHAGRPGEVGGSAPGDARSFSSEEGYTWHEQGPVADWAKSLSYKEHQALSNYASFGYHGINDQLRGMFTPRIINEYVRPATPEEIARVTTGSSTQDKVTPESIERFGHPFMKNVKDFDPEDPYHRVILEDGSIGRIVHDVYYRPNGGEIVEYSIQRAVPDLKAVEQLKEDARSLNTLIADHGYVLPESIEVGRAAYLPGVSFEDLQASVGTIREEKGFSSTMVGEAQGRLTSYVALGKFESIYNRYGGRPIHEHEDEVGSAVRMHIVLPEGTHVASIEATRRIDYHFPEVPDPDYPGSTTRDFTATPTADARQLVDKRTRVESELLLGSGAQFRVHRVERDGEYRSSDGSLKPVPIIDMYLVYVGGGSSDPKGQRS